MKVLFYCQHVLGVGHFFRVLEICRALRRHEVILVTGGEAAPSELPGHIRQVKLQGLMMDEAFSALYSVDPAVSVEAAKKRRRDDLMALFEAEAPALFIVELYPFGRKAFRFELDPVLAAVRDAGLPSCRVICSLRDILVEKKDTAVYEERVVSTLNRWFDALFIHADPGLIRLDETFSRVFDIRIPAYYTGFITPMPSDGARERIRNTLGICGRDQLIVVSAGGGKVGAPLLTAAVSAFSHLGSQGRYRMIVLTGPYIHGDHEAALREVAKGDPSIRIERFSSEFLDLLAASDLSVSMGGYNTVMNLLAAGARALVFAFDQNREQRMRAERLERLGALTLLKPRDLDPGTLAKKMEAAIQRPVIRASVQLTGAAETARLVELVASQGKERLS